MQTKPKRNTPNIATQEACAAAKLTDFTVDTPTAELAEHITVSAAGQVNWDAVHKSLSDLYCYNCEGIDVTPHEPAEGWGHCNHCGLTDKLERLTRAGRTGK